MFELESGIVATKRFLVFLPEHPSLAAGPDDVLQAVWNSGQNDDDVFLRRSDDGGATFDNLRVSSTSFDSSVGPVFDQDFGADFGTRIGLDSTDTGAVATWTDTRLGDVDDSRQDVFATTIAGLGSAGFPWWILVAAVVLGAALAWFTVELARRQRPEEDCVTGGDSVRRAS